MTIDKTVPYTPTGPSTWSSAQLDSEIQAINAKGTAQTQTDAIQLDALVHIKSDKEQLAAILTSGPPRDLPIQQIVDLNRDLARYNQQYENAHSIAAGISTTEP